MKNKKFVKLFILGSVITSFLFVLFFGVNVNAEEIETPNTENETTEVVENETPTTDEQTQEQEEQNQEQPVEQTNNSNGFIEYFSGWSVDNVKAWVVGLIAKTGLDAGVLLVLVIYLLKLRIKNIKDSEKYQELKASLDAEHQKEVERIEKSFDDRLAEIQAYIVDYVKQQDEAKKEEIKGNIATLKTQLDNIKADIEK